MISRWLCLVAFVLAGCSSAAGKAPAAPNVAEGAGAERTVGEARQVDEGRAASRSGSEGSATGRMPGAGADVGRIIVTNPPGPIPPTGG